MPKSRLLHIAIHAESVEEREKAIRQLYDEKEEVLRKLVEATTVKEPEFFQSYKDPELPVCYVCGRNENQMSEYAAWQATLMRLLPLEDRRKLCVDCRDEPRQCTKCGKVAKIKFSGGNFEYCAECISGSVGY